MSVTAKLRLQLLAENVVVAESDDPVLWQQALLAITSSKPLVAKGVAPERPEGSDRLERDPIDNFASELSLPREVILGSCSPDVDEPFIHLDSHYYEALKRKSSRGPGSVAPAVLAATLLLLWFKAAKIERPVTVPMAQAILKTLSIRDANAYRSVKNAEWIQSRGSSLFLNPAYVSEAVRVARAYCSKTSGQE
jgi:hypothetical protein